MTLFEPDPPGLRERRTCTIAGSPSLTLHVVTFDEGEFQHEAFARVGIDCPAQVQRSVCRRQAEFFFGRLAARAAMTSLGMPPAQVHIGMHREPLWPHGVTGSITHTSRMAMATALVSGACQGVGIDVEQIIAADACAALEGTVIDRIEYELLRAVTGLSYLEAVTITFSAKESLYKAAYASVGRFFDFSAARVTDLDPRERTITLELTETLSEVFIRGQTCVISFARPDQNLLLTYFVWYRHARLTGR